MGNKLLIIALVIVLLGLAVGTPLYVLGKQKTELKNEVSGLEDSMAELQVTITEQGNTIEQLQASKAGLETEREDLRQIVTELEVTISELADAMEELQTANTALETEREVLLQAITQLEEAKTILENNIAILETQLVGQYDINNELLLYEAQLEEKIEDLETAINELQLTLHQVAELNVVQKLMVAVMAANSVTTMDTVLEADRVGNLAGLPTGSGITIGFSDLVANTDVVYWYYWDANGIVYQSETAP